MVLLIFKYIALRLYVKAPILVLCVLGSGGYRVCGEADWPGVGRDGGVPFSESPGPLPEAQLPVPITKSS